RGTGLPGAGRAASCVLASSAGRRQRGLPCARRPEPAWPWPPGTMCLYVRLGTRPSENEPKYYRTCSSCRRPSLMAAPRVADELREALLCPSARGRVFCVVVVCVDACHGGRPGDATTSRCAPGCPRRRRGRPVTGTGLPERQVGRGPDRR